MGALAKDMKLCIDSGPQQRRIEFDALVRGSQPIDTSINDEHRADVARFVLGGSAGFYQLAGVIGNTRIKQAGKIRHSADFGFR